MNLKQYLLLIPLIAATGSFAQDLEDLPRPVLGEYRLETGHTSALSTYLSPIKYSGKVYSVSGEWRKASQWNPEKLIMQFSGGVSYRDMLNPYHSAVMLGIDGNFSWGVGYRFNFPKQLQLTVGGSVAANGGCLYLTRNSNNPVSINARIGLNLNAALSWRTRIGRLPIILEDEVTLPTIGGFFAPPYGETYYEIYLGNRKGLAHCGWWGNNFGIDNLLSLRLDLGRTALQVGYRYNYDSSHANHLNMAISAHSFVIGVIPHGLGIKRKQNINSPLYR